MALKKIKSTAAILVLLQHRKGNNGFAFQIKNFRVGSREQREYSKRILSMHC